MAVPYIGYQPQVWKHMPEIPSVLIDFSISPLNAVLDGVFIIYIVLTSDSRSLFLHVQSVRQNPFC